METVDLSFLSEKIKFKKEIILGKETGRLLVHFNPPHSCYISVTYRPYRGFERSFGLKEVPARITRGLVRLGASDAYMRELMAAYEEILTRVAEVRHDQLHEDNPEYDF